MSPVYACICYTLNTMQRNGRIHKAWNLMRMTEMITWHTCVPSTLYPLPVILCDIPDFLPIRSLNIGTKASNGQSAFEHTCLISVLWCIHWWGHAYLLFCINTVCLMHVCKILVARYYWLWHVCFQIYVVITVIIACFVGWMKGRDGIIQGVKRKLCGMNIAFV